jgi:hypothetical protein
VFDRDGIIRSSLPPRIYPTNSLISHRFDVRSSTSRMTNCADYRPHGEHIVFVLGEHRSELQLKPQNSTKVE